MSASALVLRPADLDAADADLVAAVRAGDDRAFETLYGRYQPRITAYVRGIVHDHGRAEDITQEVFMSALRRMRGTEVAIAFKPWIYEIAKNACIDAWRRSRNTNEVSFDAQDALGADDHGRLVDPGLTPDSAVDTKDTIDNLCGAFGGLSPAHHEILVMRELEGLSYREIGERLGMSRPGVESTLFRARKRLSEEYEELVSGERCLRVQRIVDSPGGRPTGLREQRRMDRHLAHCQQCRRYARLAGVDLDRATRPASRPAAAAARIAAWFPLPVFLRRRWGGGEELVSHAHHGPVAQWSASVASSVDPGIVSTWSKAAATVATVAVAGLGAGAAIKEHKVIERLVGGGAKPAHHDAAPRSSAGSAGATARSTGAARADHGGAGAPDAVAAAGAGQADAQRAAGNPTGVRRAVVQVNERRHPIAARDAPDATPTPPSGSKTDPRDGGAGTAAVSAAPGSTTAGTAAGQTLNQIVSTVGGTAGTVGDTAAAAPTAPAASDSTSTTSQRPLADAVSQAGATVGALPGPATSAPAATRPSTTAPSSLVSTATGLIDSVSDKVNETLASTTASRLAP